MDKEQCVEGGVVGGVPWMRTASLLQGGTTVGPQDEHVYLRQRERQRESTERCAALIRILLSCRGTTLGPRTDRPTRERDAQRGKHLKLKVLMSMLRRVTSQSARQQDRYEPGSKRALYLACPCPSTNNHEGPQRTGTERLKTRRASVQQLPADTKQKERGGLHAAAIRDKEESC